MLDQIVRAGSRGSGTATCAIALVIMVMTVCREMPGLSLNLNQASRSFGLRDTKCRVVLNDLVMTDDSVVHHTATIERHELPLLLNTRIYQSAFVNRIERDHNKESPCITTSRN